MIITDGTHLVSDSSEQELQEFALTIGLKPEWYQTRNTPPGKHPHWHRHYDIISKRKLAQALAKGAKRVSSHELLRRAWWSEYKHRQRQSAAPAPNPAALPQP